MAVTWRHPLSVWQHPLPLAVWRNIPEDVTWLLPVAVAWRPPEAVVRQRLGVFVQQLLEVVERRLLVAVVRHLPLAVALLFHHASLRQLLLKALRPHLSQALTLRPLFFQTVGEHLFFDRMVGRRLPDRKAELPLVNQVRPSSWRVPPCSCRPHRLLLLRVCP